MAISQFVDEQGTNLNKYSLLKEDGTSFNALLTRQASITQQGTLLNASKMNELVNEINGVTNAYIKSIVYSNSQYTITKQDNGTLTIALANLGGVPTTRTINGKALNGDITLYSNEIPISTTDGRSIKTLLGDLYNVCSTKLPLSGGTMNGEINMGSSSITNVSINFHSQDGYYQVHSNANSFFFHYFLNDGSLMNGICVDNQGKNINVNTINNGTPYTSANKPNVSNGDILNLYAANILSQLYSMNIDQALNTKISASVQTIAYETRTYLSDGMYNFIPTTKNGQYIVFNNGVSDSPLSGTVQYVTFVISGNNLYVRYSLTSSSSAIEVTKDDGFSFSINATGFLKQI